MSLSGMCIIARICGPQLYQVSKLLCGYNPFHTQIYLFLAFGRVCVYDYFRYFEGKIADTNIYGGHS